MTGLLAGLAVYHLGVTLVLGFVKSSRITWTIDRMSKLQSQPKLTASLVAIVALMVLRLP